MVSSRTFDSSSSLAIDDRQPSQVTFYAE